MTLLCTSIFVGGFVSGFILGLLMAMSREARSVTYFRDHGPFGKEEW